MESGAFLKWGVTSAQEIRRWDDRIQILDERPLFKGMKKGLAFRDKVGTAISDIFRIMSMVHLHSASSS